MNIVGTINEKLTIKLMEVYEPQPMTFKLDVDQTITAGEILDCIDHQLALDMDTGYLIRYIDLKGRYTRLAHMPAPMVGRMKGFFRAHYNNNWGRPFPEGAKTITVNDISKPALEYLRGIIADCFAPDEELRFEYWYEELKNFHDHDISHIYIWLVSKRHFGGNFKFPLRASANT